MLLFLQSKHEGEHVTRRNSLLGCLPCEMREKSWMKKEKDMEVKKVIIVVCGMLLVVLFGMQGCKGKGVGHPYLFERQERVLAVVKHPMTGDTCSVGIAVEVPKEGGTPLADSVMAYLNVCLHGFFEAGSSQARPLDSVFTTDSRRLLGHYCDAYRSFQEADGYLPGTDCLEVVVAAQTPTYVTYESIWSFNGEGLTVSRDWKTFRKSDGRTLGEVVSQEGLVRFMEEHPGLRNGDIWEDIQCKLKNGSTVADSYGLLGDTVVHQHTYANGVYETGKYPLDDILPYLTEEAREWAR